VSLLAPKKVLAVDDSETFLQTVAETLRAEGYEPILAHSGEEALALLAIQPTDCVLLDVTMPGLGGQETCRRIKAAPGIRDIPVIMLDAIESREAMLDGLHAGADDYISKSSDLQILKARIQAQLRRRQFEDENRSIRERLLQAELEAREARAAAELARVREALLQDLELKNQELEAFSYSVSHDLRAPLRSVDGFSNALLEEHVHQLDATGQGYLRRVLEAAKRMNALIDDLIELSRVTNAELQLQAVDLTRVGARIARRLAMAYPTRDVAWTVDEGLVADVDPRLAEILLENLLGNAWKFTGKTPSPRVTLGAEERDGARVFSVKDNGAGFDEAYASRLFAPFQRLHSAAEFPGTGIGLATVRRIVERHGGRVWAEAKVGAGAAVYWTF
jgi:signal transduction histidine kinase